MKNRNVKHSATAVALALSLALGVSSPVLASADTNAVLESSDAQSWYYDSARWAICAGVADGSAVLGAPVSAADWAAMAETSWPGCGVSATDGLLDRAAAVASLFSASGAASVAEHTSFADVTPESPFYDAVSWALSEGITNGTGADCFSPEIPVTMEQAVTMLYRWRMAEAGYVEQPVRVYREGLDEDESATLRFYREQPHVPYMEITDFYNRFELIKTEGLTGMTASRNGDVYTLTLDDGLTATVDTATDTLETANLEQFITLAFAKQEDVEDENHPYLQIASQTRTPEKPQPSTLRLGDYHIDLRSDGNGLWFPLATLSNLFDDMLIYYVLYNGESIYACDYMLQYQAANAKDAVPDFYAFLDTPRPEDLVEFDYNEFCFCFDTYYGHPGSATIEDALTEYGGLDVALRAEYPELFALLHSADWTKYLTGVTSLFYGPLVDGGHTTFIDFTNVDEKTVEEIVDFTVENYLGTQNRRFLLNNLAMALLPDQWDEAFADRDVTKLGSCVYYEEADTAYFRFDSFMSDYDGWKAYYAGETDTLPHDSLGSMVTALELAQSNPDIQNFVLDISLNGGGEEVVLATMASLVTGKGVLHTQNLLSGQFVDTEYQVDRNFDREFDDKDTEVYYDFNFAVLTSPVSFSCGNYFPAALRDAGVMVIGGRSGGGACSIQIDALAHGLVFFMSSPTKFVDNSGASVDGGIEPDVDLTATTTEDGIELPDYSAFYDFEVLRREINAFYNQ